MREENAIKKTQEPRGKFSSTQLHVIQLKESNLQKKRLSHAEDAPEVSIETQIPMRVFSAEMVNFKITITIMEMELRSNSAKRVPKDIMLQRNLSMPSLKACLYNSILHALKLMILVKLQTVT